VQRMIGVREGDWIAARRNVSHLLGQRLHATAFGAAVESAERRARRIQFGDRHEQFFTPR